MALAKPAWYVSVQDAGRVGLVLGPFHTEAACRAWAYFSAEDGGDANKHRELVDIADKVTGGRAWFYAWGMVKLQDATRTGTLNNFCAWEP